MKKYILLLVLMMVAVCGGSVAQAADTRPLVITELQTGGLSGTTENGRLEFVELYNTGETTLDVSDWEVAYLSSDSSVTGHPTRLLGKLQGMIPSGGHILLASPDWAASNPTIKVDARFDAGSTTTAASGWLAKGGGYIRLTDAAGAVQDVIAWGSAPAVTPWWHAPEIPAGSSIARLLSGDEDFKQDGAFAAPAQAVSPQGGDLLLPVESTTTCGGVVLSEIMPNAAGTDSGKEFIELYNPTTGDVNLHGCSLRLGDGKAFSLPDEQLAAGAYRAFYDTETGLTLPNATGTTVWLLGDAEQGVRYPDDLGDDQAWALIDGAWQLTTKPTPGAPNELAVLEDKPAADTSADATLAPCEPGKERNPETNRCRTIATVAALQSCSEGQERNPATNRCRAVQGASTTLAACKISQERNPDTNRCRSVTANTASSLKSCGPGQERNPSTNRCRKATAANLAKVQDVPTSSVTGNPWRWWLAAGVLVLATSYALYEWRDDLARLWRRWREKLQRHKPT